MSRAPVSPGKQACATPRRLCCSVVYLNGTAWIAGGVDEGVVLPFSKAVAHAALNPPEGHINQLEALRHYLLQVENQLFGVLDRGWIGVPC